MTRRHVWRICAVVIPLLASSALRAADPSLEQTAHRFGALPAIRSISLSPDGKHLLLVSPNPSQRTILWTVDLAGDGGTKPVVKTSPPDQFVACGWTAADRALCSERVVINRGDGRLAFQRLVSFDIDGKNPRQLGQRDNGRSLGFSQFNAGVLDWGNGEDGTVLLDQSFVPEQSIGTHLAETREGLGVVRVNTRTLRTETVVPPNRVAGDYLTDGHGTVRIMSSEVSDPAGRLTGQTAYWYRKPGSNEWNSFSRTDADGKGALVPIAADASCDCAYAIKSNGGRAALYSVKLDGSMTATLLLSNPQVDIDDVVRVGRGNRVIGATYSTDQRSTDYFDPTYKALATSLSKALPGLPLVDIVDSSADEKKLLIRAGSDVDPGRYYLLDRESKRMGEVLLDRPELAGVQLAPVKSIAYRADDGTMVPAYLTLPVGGATRGLPAIVLPHGGPAARDYWGFDWLAQFFAARGFAVLQPNFRGSSGYGDSWFADNGFKSWRIAIGDVVAAGRWLVSEGIAEPKHLAIFGWSYGGYAALQATALDPKLFKAVIAVAPVTDLGLLKQQFVRFTNYKVESRYIGDGPHVAEGSPTHHAAEFAAPVLMFHGTVDDNVDVAESREMQSRLEKAGKQSQLVIYPGLDHQLADADARADLLAKSDAFLRKTLGL